jgi:hypothetical protein
MDSWRKARREEGSKVHRRREGVLNVLGRNSDKDICKYDGRGISWCGFSYRLGMLLKPATPFSPASQIVSLVATPVTSGAGSSLLALRVFHPYRPLSYKYPQADVAQDDNCGPDCVKDGPDFVL